MSRAKKRPRLSVQEQIAVCDALSQGAAASLLGILPGSLRASDAPRKGDGDYRGPDLVAWWRAKAAKEQADDPLLGEGDSPNLERYRAARADLAEMEAAERRTRLVDVDAFTEWWVNEVALSIRRGIETLHQRFGPEAAAVMTTAVAKADGAVEAKRPAE